MAAGLTPPGRAGASRRLRAEIQGLRAVAVGIVVVYHLDPAALPGGFVGVDVFFVISGFLISRHLLQEAERTGRVDLAAFWAGRVRRILPAALVTIAVVVAAALVLLPRTQASTIGWTGVWAAASAANWLFAAQSVDYQAQSPDASPFEHFWSLGVEEQFYLVWPLLVLLVAAVALRRRGSVRRWATIPFGVVLLGSLAFGVWFTASGSQAAYFITPTRMWELAAGGLLAALAGDRALRPLLAGVLQVGGIAAIGGSAVLFTAATPMPGVAALVPVLGAVGVIAGGDVPGLRRLWALAPVRFVGDTSYSLYLWHWPLIVLARTLTGHEAGTLQRVALVGASLLAATASYLVVERPFRRVRVRRPLRVVAVGVAAVVLTVGIGVTPALRDAAVTRAEQQARASVLDPGAGSPLGFPHLDAAADGTWARPQHVPVPDPATLVDDVAFARCTVQPQSRTSPVCALGDVRSGTTIALVGDSHALQWAGALDAVAKAHHWRLLTILHNSCPFSLTPRPFELSGHSHCTEAVRWALPVLEAQHVSVVLTSAYRKSYPRQLDRAADGYAAMWRDLRRHGMPVVALGDTSSPPADPTIADCAVGPAPASCGISRAAAERVPDPLRAAAARAGVPFLDPVAALCGTTRCPGIVGNVVVYRDDNHVSTTYLLTAVPWLQQHLVPLLERARRGHGSSGSISEKWSARRR